MRLHSRHWRVRHLSFFTHLVLSGVYSCPLTQWVTLLSRRFGFNNLPLADASRLFSRRDPRHRWAGLTHAGTSQVWQTHSGLFQSPSLNPRATRCANAFLPCHDKRPYPSLSLSPVHNQQPNRSLWSTLAQKRGMAMASWLALAIALPLAWASPWKATSGALHKQTTAACQMTVGNVLSLGECLFDTGLIRH